MEILKTYDKVLPYIDIVSNEADKNNINLGFLPKCDVSSVRNERLFMGIS